MVLAPVDVVIRPNAFELISVFGLPQTGLFRKFTASARIVKDRVSSIWTFFATPHRRGNSPALQTSAGCCYRSSPDRILENDVAVLVLDDLIRKSACDSRIASEVRNRSSRGFEILKVLDKTVPYPHLSEVPRVPTTVRSVDAVLGAERLSEHCGAIGTVTCVESNRGACGPVENAGHLPPANNVIQD